MTGHCHIEIRRQWTSFMTQSAGRLRLLYGDCGNERNVDYVQYMLISVCVCVCVCVCVYVYMQLTGAVV